MAAMKPRTGDGPLEVTKEGRGIVMRVPLEGGGRLVVEISADEAQRPRRRAEGRSRLTTPVLAGYRTAPTLSGAGAVRCRTGQTRLVELDGLLGDRRPGELALRPLPAGGAHRRRPRRVGDQLVDRGGDGRLELRRIAFSS